jgi:acetyltransferase-like isoleucine patch superfamily enzyme
MLKMKLLNKIYLFIRALPKSIFFNLKYLKFKEALMLPILVSHRVLLSDTKGRITIEAKPKIGLITIGFGDVGIFDKHLSRSVWKVLGHVCFKGSCSLGHGSKICVAQTGELMLGDNFLMTAESSILCRENIIFGKDCLVSWEVLMMDTDYHTINDMHGRQINHNKQIVVGDHVWIGCRSTVLKGSVIPDNSVIAAGCLVTGSFTKTNQIIGGTPARTLRENINWTE